ENAVGEALLYNVTEQFGVRDIWQASLGMGYTGNSDKAIAILDTGIDDTHLDSAFTLAYWQDFVGANASLSSPVYYPTATDLAEHGTHCASIAASSGAQTTTGAWKVTDSGFFPITDGWHYYGTGFYIPTAQTVTINFSWSNSGGTVYVGFEDELGVDVANNYFSPASGGVGTFSYSISSAGWYWPYYGSVSGEAGNFYSAEVAYNSGWTNPYTDGRGPFTGVAPDSQIVGLKVLDDFGITYTSQFLLGLDWLYNNGQDYDVTVASMSLGFGQIVSSVDTAITNIVRNKGIVCVAAAGNGGTSAGGIFSPASCVDVISVGAVNKANEIAYYSSVGTALYPHIDVVAPGGSWAYSGSAAPYQPIIAGDSNDGDEAYSYVTSSYQTPGIDYYSNNFRGMQGTSMACPFVAGVAQLVIDAMIDAGEWEYSWAVAKKVKQIICMGTSELRNLEATLANGGETYDGDSDGTPQVTPINRVTKDYTEGWGSIYPIAAIEAVTSWMTVGTPETVSLSGKLGETRVIIRQVDLESGTLYRMEGNFTVTNFIDADLLLFKENPSETGDPMLYAACTLGIVANESLIFNVPEDGTYYFVVKWVDGSYQGDCKFSIERIISLQSHNYGDVLQSGTKISFNIDTTSLTSLTYKWDTNAPIAFSSLYEVYLPVGDGEHAVTIYMQDTWGNNAEIFYAFVTDDTKPIILLDGVSNNDEITATQNISVNIVEAHLQGVVYHWDTSADQAWAEPYTTTAPKSLGIHTLSITATDVAGNQETTIFTFEIIGSTDPTGNFMIPVFAAIFSLLLVAVIQRKKK
ncbi:MAG: S8 family serine peptidase, partial [Candidatus Heimdallarchaeota archaeon]|nr:S8 family serine peptidase [Candidatus Heimdallarchaeota archaeon]MCK4255070.1 S8 family serine peptidase [Candidatus Heimdallarchaeota archaeon]